MIIFVATAMNNYNKGKAKYILASTAMVLFISVTVGNTRNEAWINQFYKTLTTDTIPSIQKKKRTPKKDISTAVISITDTIPANTVDSTVTDSLHTKIKVDSFTVFNIRTSKDSLDAPVVYHADDSMVMDVPAKKIILYGKESKVTYVDNELTAPGIQFDQKTSLVTAF